MELNNTEICVDKIIEKVGKEIILGAPLGAGKANHLINEFYNRAEKDKTINLTILSALTLHKPGGASDLEKRFFDPFSDRLFGDYPNLKYEEDRLKNKIPSNIKVIEFYYPAGKQTQVQYAQRNYLSSNYTHAARDILDRGINVLIQQVCIGEYQGNKMYSLSCNPDIAIDIYEKLKEKEKNEGYKFAYAVQLNENLPFMYGDALVDGSQFDFVVDSKEGHYKIFGPPKMPVKDEDYMIGLFASALIKDDGELQVGIGSLGDALVYHLGIRHKDNPTYLRLLESLQVQSKFGDLIKKIGETTPFKVGLFGATEMVVDGFMHLYKYGILKKKVYDHVGIQRLINEGLLNEKIPNNILEILIKRNIIENPLREKDFNLLQKFGIFKNHDDLKWNSDCLILKDGKSFKADLNDENFFDHKNMILGETLKGGEIVHGGFFLGPQEFYDFLRNLPEEEKKLFNMKSVTKINQLYGHEELDRLHRKNARFVNTCLKMSMNGGAASDALEDGEIVSGVGGQYNFVAMAHALPDGRSVLLLRSAREGKKGPESNIVWKYGHCTIPRHLRDIVITEYGMVELRGKTDEEIIIELLKITDSRFQEGLLKEAKKKGKIYSSYVIPKVFKDNFPQSLKSRLAEFKDKGMYLPFPFGTDFTPEELKIGKALKELKKVKQKKLKLMSWMFKAIVLPPPASKEFEPLLKRMDYLGKLNFKQRLFKNLLLITLHHTYNK